MKKLSKILLSCALIVFGSLVSVIPTSAATDCSKIPDSAARQKCLEAGGNNNSNSGSFVDGTCSYILGLTSWNCGVDIHDEESLKTGIWQIVANIATDITVIAAYLVLGYVIYGGYLYIFSEGEPGKAASGKKTLRNAFIGLAIVMSASLIMSTIRFALLGAGGKLDNCANSACVNPNDLVTGTIQWFIGIAGAVAAIFVLYGGISYITSSGDPTKLQKAKQSIIYALIGLAIVALAEAITAFVSNMIRQADSGTSSITTNNVISIKKEPHEKTI